MRNFYAGLALITLVTLGCTNCSAQNKPVFSIPFTLIDNRQFIDVNIKHHTFHFILDCGADYGLDAKTAKSLNLGQGKKSRQSGAGAKTVEAGTSVVDTAKIGPIDVVKARFLVIDMSEIRDKLHLPYLDGIIGYTFMKNYAVQTDYPGRVISFYRSYSAPSPVPFVFYQGQLPRINVQIDGINASVIIDTGDRTAFTLFNHFAIKNGFITKYKLSDTTITGYGLGGPIYARTFSLNHFKIGKLSLANVATRIPMLKTGAFADKNIDGSIGGGVLKKYKFTIDYKKQDLYFQ